LLAYLTKYLISALCFRWANSYVDPNCRGEYSATKEMVSLFAGIVFTLIIGAVVDYYESIDYLEGGFVIIAIILLSLNICNFICLLLIKSERDDKNTATSRTRIKLKDVLENTLGNPNFVTVIAMSSLWSISRYMTIGFLGTFKTVDLILSLGAVQVINMIANLCRLFLSKPMGRYSDRTSYATGYRMGLVLAAVAFAASIFCTKDTWWLIIVHTIFYNLSLAGTNQNGFNITYSYVKKEYVVQAMAIEKSISGVCGFGAALAGSQILQYVQSSGNVIWGMKVFGQQLLSAISLVITIITIIFIRFVIEKQSRMIQ